MAELLIKKQQSRPRCLIEDHLQAYFSSFVLEQVVNEQLHRDVDPDGVSENFQSGFKSRCNAQKAHRRILNYILSIVVDSDFLFNANTCSVVADLSTLMQPGNT